MNKFICTLSLLLSLTVLPELSLAKTDGVNGGGDVFPHSCVTFQGEWKGDRGNLYSIEQQKCEHVVIVVDGGVDLGAIELVPDNQERELDGGDHHLIYRHRWNSQDFGSTLIMNLRYVYEDKVITEVRSFDYVSYYLILESIHRTIEDLNTGVVDRQNDQELFRRVIRRKSAQ